MQDIIRFEKPAGDLALNPCPFCGCSGALYAEYKTKVGNRWMVLCPDCMASIDPGYAQQRSTVQTMWNRRA